jgi:signal transduction histidine kinase
MGRTIYRVVQEGLTNARKHAAGEPVDVVLDGAPGDRLRIDVTNPVPLDGSGLPTAPGSGTGLIAGELDMSVPTVKAHITHVLTKLGLTNRTQIALLVHDAGLT